jgi:hypothetical protein
MMAARWLPLSFSYKRKTINAVASLRKCASAVFFSRMFNSSSVCYNPEEKNHFVDFNEMVFIGIVQRKKWLY